jgi:hypothetical protein
MRTLRSTMFLWTLLLCTVAVRAGEPLPVMNEGVKLRETLDMMDVMNRWKPNEHITHWKTGESDDKTGGPKTHCSLFAAAVCWKLDAPLLSPPPQTLLANRQQDWLFDEGKKKGWKKLDDALEAQKLANEGVLVLASYKNPDAKKAGHIAVVRPSEIDAAALKKSGPRITQAGATNYEDTDVKTGFKNHPGAFENGEILYFAYQSKMR